MEELRNTTVRNWFGDLTQEVAAVVTARSVDDIVAVMKDPSGYPSPVRAIGSNHSTTRCGVADGGTIIDMSEMTEILHIGEDTVTAQAGALYLDVNKALAQRGLQFYVNVELGNLTMGSAACGGTKDASMPGEFGQVCSYAIGIKMVTPAGELVEITEDDGELMQVARSSYGLLGVMYEVTFRVQRLRPMSVRHGRYSVQEFVAQLPALWERGDSMMLYLFPFQGKVGVEFRRYQDSGKIKSRWPWRLRNWIWGKFAPGYAHFVTRFVPTAFAKRVFTGLLARILYLSIGLIRGTHTSPIDQQIRYPEHGGFSRYTFSIWGFPEGRYPELLPAYFEFCKEYERDTGFRCDLISVGYRVFEDRNPLFSYTWDGDVMTLDPVSTGSDGWHEFLVAYNEFCSAEGGVPLFNQTNHITRDQSQRAFGDRLATFERYRGEYDPENRLLTDYFREMLGL